jgi:hypothetical protein
LRNFTEEELLPEIPAGSALRPEVCIDMIFLPEAIFAAKNYGRKNE